MKKLLAILLFVIAFSHLNAQSENQNKNTDWIFNAQALVRPELDGRDFSDVTYAPIYTGMRIRFGVEKTVFDNMQIVIQVQDARYFGQEGAPTKLIDNIDLYQGFVRLTNLFDTPIYAQAGRFEVAYSDQRIFGSSQWNLGSRAWDGVRFGWDEKDIKADLFALSYNWAGVPTISSSGYNWPSKQDTSISVYGLYTQFNLSKDMKLDVYGYLEENKKQSNKKDNDLSRFTAGARYAFNFGDLFGKVEGAYQMGKQKDLDIAAYLLVLSLGYDFEPLKTSLNFDMSSGTANNDRATNMNLFDAVYSTKHGIQGFMDYFTNISNSTLGYGLNDIFLRLFYQEKNSPFSAQLDVHHFMSNQEVKLSNNSFNTFGQEIDLVLAYKINKFATLEWGGSVFLPGDITKEMWIVPNSSPIIYREDMSFWSYLALKVSVF